MISSSTSYPSGKVAESRTRVSGEQTREKAITRLTIHNDFDNELPAPYSSSLSRSSTAIPNPSIIVLDHLISDSPAPKTPSSTYSPPRPPWSPLRPERTAHRRDINSGLSLRGLEELRFALSSFRKSLRPGSTASVHETSMSFTSQAFSFGLMETIIADLRPEHNRHVSDPHPNESPLMQRVQAEYGHRRTYSNPMSGAGEEVQRRARTMSDGGSVQNRERASLGIHAGVERAIKMAERSEMGQKKISVEEETHKGGSGEDQTYTGDTSKLVSYSTSSFQKSDYPPTLPSTSSLAQFPLSSTTSQFRISHPKDSQSSPAVSAVNQTPVPGPGVPPPLVPVPKTPGKTMPIKQIHPFAAGRETSEKAESLRSKESGDASISKEGKGKERGDVREEGRKQTPRRGLVAVIARISSRPSLPQIHTSHPSPTFESREISDQNPPAGHSPTLPDSATFLRPAPQTPGNLNPPRYGSSRTPSPSRTPVNFAPRAGETPMSMSMRNRWDANDVENDMVEIPRFKKKELNLGIVRRQGYTERIAWMCLWAMWLVNGLSSLFFDVNVIYILVQCTSHPSFESNSGQSWRFAIAAYGACWGISVIVVWLGWEFSYEFWRRWRTHRPAIEPIYLSLPASLHLSLYSFDHFTFLLHIRTSTRGTSFSKDMIPETCHALVQLLPGLIPLLPRAAIATVILIAFWDPRSDVKAPFGGSVDQSTLRDRLYFEESGELSQYAKGALLAFVAWTAFRLFIVISSAIGLWLFSSRPLGGLSSRPAISSRAPATPRKAKSSIQTRDPATTASPSKSWREENEFDWKWRDRTRARIQDAFELCIIRRHNGTSFLVENGTPWGARKETPNTSVLQLGKGASKRDTPPEIQELLRHPETPQSGLFKGLISKKASSLGTPKTIEAPRPESMLDPNWNTAPQQDISTPKKEARGLGSHPSTSSHDLFYTPMGSTALNPSRSFLSAGNTPTPSQTPIPPPSAFRQPQPEPEERLRKSEDSADSIKEDTASLLSNANVAISPRTSLSAIKDAVRNRSSTISRARSASTLSQNPSLALLSRTNSANSDRSGSKHNRRRSSTSNVPNTPGVLSRARSTSVSLIQSGSEVVEAAGGLVRRARSGTLGEDGYQKVEDDFSPSLDAGLTINHHLPKRRSRLGLGLPGGENI